MRGVDDKRNLVVLDQINHIRATLAQAADVFDFDTVLLEELSSAYCGNDTKAECTQALGYLHCALFVSIFHANKDVARMRQCRLGSHL